MLSENECVAQLVEHLTFNQVALGSNPSALTIYKKHHPLWVVFFINEEHALVNEPTFGERGR